MTDNYARPFIYRKTCAPFPSNQPDGTPRLVLAMICTVIEPVVVNDSLLGDGSYSIQFQSNDDDGVWSQGAFQFSPKYSSSPIFQVYEADSKSQKAVKLYYSIGANNPIPKIDGLGIGHAYTVQLKDDGTNLYCFASIQDPAGNIIWQSGDTKYNKFGNPIDGQGVACGLGGGSVANFTAGRFRFQILGSPACGDMTFIQPNPFLGIPMKTPCGNPILFTTAEADNMRYSVIGSSGGSAIGYEEFKT